MKTLLSKRLVILFCLSLLLIPKGEIFAQRLYPVWNDLNLGKRIGTTGLFIIDLDLDGQKEILVGDWEFFSILSRDSSQYEVSWTSKLYDAREYDQSTAPIKAITVRKDQGSGQERIYVLLSDGQMDVYDGQNLSLLYSHDFMYPKGITTEFDFYGFEVNDLDGDQIDEILILSDMGVDIFDLASLQIRTRVSLRNARGMALANLDSDPALEIVVNQIGTNLGYEGVVVDGATLIEEWNNPRGFGNSFSIGDLTGDGQAEILALYTGNDSVIAFDPRTQSVLWEKRETLGHDNLEIFKIPSDSIPYIYVPHSGGVKKHHPMTYDFISFIEAPNSGSGTNHIVFDDIDLDGSYEMLFDRGWTNTDSDHLFLANPATGEMEWNSIDTRGPYYTNFGDVDGDGIEDLVVTSFVGECGCNYRGYVTNLRVYDPITHKLKRSAQKNLMGIRNVGRVYDTKLHNVDSDPELEVIIQTKSSLKIYDYVQDTIITEKLFSNSLSLKSAIGDIDRDGIDEMLVLDSRMNLYSLNVEDFSENWSMSFLTVSQTRILLDQLDADSALEIILLSRSGIKILDGITRNLEWQSNTFLNNEVYGNLVDINQDGYSDIFSADRDGNFLIVTSMPYSETYLTKDSLNMGLQFPLTNIHIADVDQSPGLEIITQTDRLKLFSYPGFNQISETEYGFEQGWPYQNNDIIVNDIDNDGERDVWVADRRGMFHFKNGPLWATSIGEDLSLFENPIAYQVYPNPTKNLLKIKKLRSDLTSIKEVILMDIQGRMIANFQPGNKTSEEIEILLPDYLPPAYYLLRIEVENRYEFIKFFKTN